MSRNVIMPYSRCLITVLLVAVAAGCELDSLPSGGVERLGIAPLAINDRVRNAETPPDQNWKMVLEPRALTFPADHGPHPDYRIEWWYYTGNLETSDGRRFGYQLTFFRSGVQQSPTNPSRWAVRDVYIGHFALSDISQSQFRRYERSSRAGIAWAGADAETGRIWNGSWEVRYDPTQHRLRAEQQGDAIDLVLKPSKPPILHGNQGLSQKGAAPGNASHYYSFTRLETSGRLTLDGESHQVRGLSWMDHEFSSSFLEEGQAGWDWFSLQFDDGRELMLYQMRGTDGAADPHSSGTLIEPDGSYQHLTREMFVLKPSQFWRSPSTGHEYPLSWQIALPRHGWQLTVNAAHANQEMDTRASTGIIYWEGAVDVRGQAGEQGMTGLGYLEMVR